MSIRTSNQSFPDICSECGKAEVRPAAIPYDAEVKYEGHLYQFHITRLDVAQCAFCGDIVFDHTTHEQIYDALRKHLNLLSRQEIRDWIERLGLTQKELGTEIGIAPETISRWLSGGYVQSRAYDNLMRFYFEREEANRIVHSVGGVVLIDGSLSPWNRQISSQTSRFDFPSDAMSSDTGGESIQGDMALVA
jgi:DNA-binding transcriptional regulator YiaG